MAAETRPTSSPPASRTGDERISSGVAGLDEVLGGGLMPRRVYLIEGATGTGKTTLALQFLLAGQARGESGLYVSFSETEEELQVIAASHGWSLGGISLVELGSSDHHLDREMTLLHPWEIELGETVNLITEHAARVGARRVVLDSLSEMRLLAQEPLRFRRQVLSLKQFFNSRDSTVLLLSNLGPDPDGHDLQIQSLTHGIIELERKTLEFGMFRRRLQVPKLRGTPYREGWHDMAIRTGGLIVFPRLMASEHSAPRARETAPSGIAELDAMMDGGPQRGTSTLLTGSAGVGKSTLALQYVVAAARRGERSVLYEFDERIVTLFHRAAALGLDLESLMAQGLVTVEQLDPAQISPGEFTRRVMREVEERNARLVVVDSLNGYLSAMPEEKQLILQLRDLLSFLSHRGVLTLLINPQHGLIGSIRGSIDLSYLADTVLLLRFFETEGRVRKALSVLKHRSGAHNNAIREYRIDRRGINMGDELTEFQGVLTGTPSYLGDRASPIEDRDEDA